MQGRPSRYLWENPGSESAGVPHRDRRGPTAGTVSAGTRPPPSTDAAAAPRTSHPSPEGSGPRMSLEQLAGPCTVHLQWCTQQRRFRAAANGAEALVYTSASESQSAYPGKAAALRYGYIVARHRAVVSLGWVPGACRAAEVSLWFRDSEQVWKTPSPQSPCSGTRKLPLSGAH
jgi:hypothetical protein